jgi:hypothetical protein
MSAGQVVSLKVMPSQSAILCFDLEGIIGQSDVKLGQSVTRFDFASFYANLGSTVDGNPARLVYDSQAIRTDKAVAASTLMGLRAESWKAVLDKAIRARENAFYQKYADQAAVIALQRQYYDPANPDSKPARLAALSAIAQHQANALNAAYQADGRQGVVKSTTSELRSTTTSSGASITQATSDGSTNSQGTNFQDNVTAGPTNRFGIDEAFSAGRSGPDTITDTGTYTRNVIDEDTSPPNVTVYISSSGQQVAMSQGTMTSSGQVQLDQAIANTDYGYRVPGLENAAQNHRSQISLMDEQFAQFMLGQNLPYLEQVFANELQAIDLDVKRLQVAYLDTILMSPIDGIVTGIFKQLGEGIKTGEAAIRVENNTPALLVGTVVYRGMLSVGATVTITSTLFSRPPGTAPTVITGTIVAAQGHTSEDDWWDVAITYDNVDGKGNPILPLHYRFDFDDTSVVIS